MVALLEDRDCKSALVVCDGVENLDVRSQQEDARWPARGPPFQQEPVRTREGLVGVPQRLDMLRQEHLRAGRPLAHSNVQPLEPRRSLLRCCSAD